MALTKRQLALRRDAIGGSEIACLVGLSRWASASEIYEAKLGTAPDKINTVAMFFGSEWEDPIAKWHAHETGQWLKPLDSIRHPTLKYAIATGDRACFLSPVQALAKKKKLQREDLAEASHLLEVKTRTWRLAKEWGEPGTDEVPEDVLAQAVWTLGCAGMQRCDVRVLFDRDRCELYTVQFVPEMFEAFYTVAERFMVDHVLAGKPPPPDATDKYKDFLGRYFPTDPKDEDLVLAKPEEVDLLLRYAKLKEAASRLKKLTDLASNQVRAAIGQHTGLTHAAFGKVTWKKTRDGTKTDWQAVAQEALTTAGLVLNTQVPQNAQHKELLDQLKGLVAKHTTPKPGYRRLHCSWKGDAKIDVQQLTIALDKLSANVSGISDEEEAEEVNP